MVAWNVTKAGFMAQAPCPMNKTGVVKRLCGSNGIWGPVQDSCTEAKILDLYSKAKVKLTLPANYTCLTAPARLPVCLPACLSVCLPT